MSLQPLKANLTALDESQLPAMLFVWATFLTHFMLASSRMGAEKQ